MKNNNLILNWKFKIKSKNYYYVYKTKLLEKYRWLGKTQKVL